VREHCSAPSSRWKKHNKADRASTVGHLVAAPDKFRGTASARRIAAAAARGAGRSGWTAREVPLADGGEGLLDVVGGIPCWTEVTGPLGEPVTAEWRLLGDAGSGGPVAVIEMARVAGRLPAPEGDERSAVDGSGAADDAPVRASTEGVGELILAARDAGALEIVVGCGGSATTDGGWGAVSVVGSSDALAGISLVVATDVRTAFNQAAEVFGPQKGASPEQVQILTDRLERLTVRYRRDFGVDVATLAGAGAAGGLAGGLAALGGRLVPGFDLVSELVGLHHHLARADLVVTGEGRLDESSFAGKVVGGVIDLVAGRVPVLAIVGSADPRARTLTPRGVEVVDLVSLAGSDRALHQTASLVEEVVADRLGAG